MFNVILFVIVTLLGLFSPTLSLAHVSSQVTHDMEIQDSPVTGNPIWIADWEFGTTCNPSSWTSQDLRLKNNGIIHTSVNSTFNGVGGIVDNAAVIGAHNLCWSNPDGYGNGWYQAVRIDYSGAPTLSFDYVLDTEAGFDFMRVETDPLCNSFSQVDYANFPDRTAAYYRTVEFQDTGLNLSGSVSVPLTNHGAGSHCVYISFFSDNGVSSEDGLFSTTLGAAVALDNLVLGGLTEDFEGGGTLATTFVNIQDNTPFGDWARLFPNITDNDLCESKAPCAWLWSDNTTPTLANSPDMAFGPGAYVLKSWLDNSILSPWVSLVTTPSATRTHLEYEIFPGNDFSLSRLALGYSVRGKMRVANTDTPAPGDSFDCVQPWSENQEWRSLGRWSWTTQSIELQSELAPEAREIQVRLRLSDWQRSELGSATAPSPFVPGPGPFLDRVRIGRQVSTGPSIAIGLDSRSQAQDAFSTVQNGITPGEHFSPSNTIFGTSAFSAGGDLGVNGITPNLVTRDSITVFVTDTNGTGGIASVYVYARIISGPHAAAIPPAIPAYSTEGDFFKVPAKQSLSPQGTIVPGAYFVDMDDAYFSGGDVLVYFWVATDMNGDKSTYPEGITLPATTVANAELNPRNGILEVSFLPTIVAGAQTTSILYVQKAKSERLTGNINRTTFLWTLEQAGYAGMYDVYDVQGFGNTNNDLASRASLAQVEGYSLIIHDSGTRRSGNIPDGNDLDSEKISQGAFYLSYLNNATSAPINRAALWLIGANLAEEEAGGPLLSQLGVVYSGDVSQNLCFDVQGMGNFTFQPSGNVADYTLIDNMFPIGSSSCATSVRVDAINAVVPAVATHRYEKCSSGSLGDAVVMKADIVNRWSSIVSTFPWDSILTPLPPKAVPGEDHTPRLSTIAVGFLSRTLEGLNIIGSGIPTGLTINTAPSVPAVYQNYPNPFNPTTTIRFDVAKSGMVELRVFDVSGRVARTLIRKVYDPGTHSVVWDGTDDARQQLASGIYMYQISMNGLVETRRAVLLK